jgi:RNA polymerase sigma factor (sigma-70 family)
METWSHDTLIRLAKSGNAPAVIALLKSNLRLVQFYVNHCPSECREDAFSAGIVAFLEAIPRFDENRTASIGTYASKFVKGAVYKSAASDRVRGIETAPIEVAYKIESSVASDIDLRLTIEAWLRRQPAETRALMRLRFYEGLTQAEISRHLGISRAAVSQRFKRIFEKARHDPQLQGCIA